MTCPACRELLHEHAPACPQCGFSLASADQAFGIPPRLNPELTDLAGVLSQRDEKRIRETLAGLHTRFPQLAFACVLTRIAPQIPLPVCVFWLFNRGGLSTPMEKGGACRLVLLVLDAEAGRAACMVGYGLEPFVSDDVLCRITAAAQPALQEHEYAEAAIQAFAQAEQELAAIAKAVPQGFGLHEGNTANATETDEVFAY